MLEFTKDPKGFIPDGGQGWCSVGRMNLWADLFTPHGQYWNWVMAHLAS